MLGIGYYFPFCMNDIMCYCLFFPKVRSEKCSAWVKVRSEKCNFVM